MNSFMILQTEQQTQLSVLVHRGAELRTIRLARSRAASECPETALGLPLELSINVKARNVETPKGLFKVEVNFRLSAINPKKPKSKEAFFVECTFQAEYELKPGFSPTLEQLNAFKDGNAIFNCWPYCRQYVQEEIARMGFPAPTLPFLRVQTVTRRRRKLAKPE